MAVKNSVQSITLSTIDSATLNGTYQAINPSGLPHPCFLIRINNASNSNVVISFDGVNDHEFVLANTWAQFNFQANSQPNNWIANLAQGTIVYAKGVPGVGQVLVSGWYQPNLS